MTNYYHYPTIELPDDFIEIVNKPPLTLEKPKEPREPLKPQEREGKLGMIDFLLVVSFIIGITLIQDRDTKKMGTIMLVIGIPSCIRVLLTIFENKSESYEVKYIDLKKRYEQDRSVYETELADYNRKTLFLNSPENLEKYRLELFRDQYKIKSLPEDVIVASAKKGISESYFKEILIKEFGDKIFSNKQVSLKGYYFYPDLVYLDTKSSLAIDIEVDEPYVGSTGEPIHYQDKDLSRDSLFTESGWFVLRFAEEQVVKYPVQCILVINKIIKAFDSHSSSILLQANEVNRIRQWTKEESHKMAFTRYRHSYLPKTMQDKLLSETFEHLTDEDSIESLKRRI